MKKGGRWKIEIHFANERAEKALSTILPLFNRVPIKKSIFRKNILKKDASQ